jgi:hypothetical protein
MAFSQSEKIKTGIIWLSHLLEISSGAVPQEKKGAERILRAILGMLDQEVRLASVVAPSGVWSDVGRLLDQVTVMFDSGVGADSVYHLTQALSRVTGIGQDSMTFLKNNGLL